MLVGALWIAAAAISGFAYFLYWLETMESKVRPNRWTWLVFSASTAVEAFTYNAVSEDIVKSSIFFASSAACWIITIAIWRKAQWEMPSWTEIACTALSVAALVLWLHLGLTLLAHLVALVAIPVAFIPTFENAIKNKREERSWAWGLWAVAEIVTLVMILLRYDDPFELPYVIIDLICHFLVWRIAWRS